MRFNLLFLLRRLVLAFAFVFNTELHYFNLIIFLVFTVINFAFILSYKPFIEKKTNYIEIVNEFTVWLATYICYTFIDPSNN